jgi:hypothetical protein
MVVAKCLTGHSTTAGLTSCDGCKGSQVLAWSCNALSRPHHRCCCCCCCFCCRFLKGLAIVDDIAYFGISPWAPRSARDDPQANNQLAAFDLNTQQLLWRREVGGR